MKKLMIGLLALLFCAVFTNSVFAIYPWGKIDDTLSYDKLDISGGNGTCRISMKVVNNSDKLYEGVYIKVYAFDIFKTMLWNHLFFISAIGPKGAVSISEKIYDCKERNPYSIKFKVTK